MLDQAIRSVLNQQFERYEIIIVDDGSETPLPSQIAGSNLIRLVRTGHGGVEQLARTGSKQLVASSWLTAMMTMNGDLTI